MKYQEYLQITKSKKQYLQDFISVLEDDDERNTTTSNFQCQMKSASYKSMHKDSYNTYYQQSSHMKTSSKGNNNKIIADKNISELQKKAREAIVNSKMAIQKIKKTISLDSNALVLKQ